MQYDGVPSEDELQAKRIESRRATLLATDPQVRAAMPLEDVAAALAAATSLAERVALLLDEYADRPALGWRALEAVTDSATGRTTLRALPSFETITYRDLGERVGALAAAWTRQTRPGDFVAILGFTGVDYVTIDLACIHLGLVSAPLHAMSPASQLASIVDETEPRVVAAGIESADLAVEIITTATHRPDVLIVFGADDRDDDHRARVETARRRLEPAGVAVETMAEAQARGRELPPAPMHIPDPGSDPLMTLVYSSGSTGAPKGVMWTQRIFTRSWNPAQNPVISVGYLPLSHGMGRNVIAMTLASGGACFFAAKSDMSTLLEDFSLVRPTVIGFPPRVADMILQLHDSAVDRRIAAGETDRAAVSAEVCADIRDRVIGGRCLSISCGAAPLAPVVRRFMETCLDLPVTIGYGASEVGVLAVAGRVARPDVIDYKLVDVPELGYFATDKPFPRGELLVKTKSLMPGYYKRPELTASMFDDDGFYRTGDVVVELAPDCITYLDRRNNVLKLSNGEFVAVAQLEIAYAASPLVRQIYIYGSSEQAFLLAVVVPSEELTGAELDDAKQQIVASMQEIAERTHLNAYEIPRDLILETEPFTSENGLLTSVGKPARAELKAKYDERLEQIYADVAAAQAAELRALRAAGDDVPVVDRVRRAAQAVLGCSPDDVRPGVRFANLGGDSLSALSLSMLLSEIFGVEVPVAVVLSPTGDVDALARFVESQRGGDSARPTFATVHGTDATHVEAADLTLDKFIDTSALATAATLPLPTGPARTILLTGANGYLGRFVCLAWLERAAERDGRVVCIVRGADDASARQRLEDAFDSGDPALVERFHLLAEGHLEVIAGDLNERSLGLDDGTWGRLAAEIDLIVHPGALVNHVLPYHQLFGPNVVGTAELVRLALTTRLKRFTNVSSLAVAFAGSSPIDEESDIRVASSRQALDNGQARGYAVSKWAGEVLLREAHDLCGLPTSVFRCDMIMAHSSYAGQLNIPDMFTRLLLSIVATGVAPRSFYDTPAGERAAAPFDGLPVEFTAEAIAALGDAATSGFHTYNVANVHEGGPSLDDFVDWLIDAGHPIQRIDDHRDWVSRFETSMLAMPDTLRHHSLLPLLAGYREPLPQRGPSVPAERFAADVHSTGGGPIPPITRDLIQKYMADLRALALLP